MTAKAAALAFALILALGASGPVASQSQEGAPSDQPGDQAGFTFSGFLGDYSRFVPTEGGVALRYEKEDRPVAGYSKYIIDPILIYFHPEARGVAVDPTRLGQLTETFHDEIVDQLEASESIQVVTEPGPGVARIRLALTDLMPAKGGAGARIGVGVAGMLVVPGGGLVAPAVAVGQAHGEGEIVDSVTGERLSAFVDHTAGRRFFNKGIKSWSDVHRGMRRWARPPARGIADPRPTRATSRGSRPDPPPRR